jgi:cell shape-determining protein MreC
MNFNLGKIKGWSGSPPAALAAALTLAVVLAILPSAWTCRLRDTAAIGLRPGQRGVRELQAGASRLTGRVKAHFRNSAHLADVEQRLESLARENRRLTAELRTAREQSREPQTDEADRLLLDRCVAARVLGCQARTFLERRGMLDVGSKGGVATGALVLDWPTVIDRGNDSQLAAGQVVLSGRRVWGKIVEVGPNTSTVRGVSEPGYRDLVKLAGGAQGILEGTGEPLARIRLIEVTVPVAEGEAVFSAAGKGVLSAAPLYGKVVRVERPPGAAHWNIWMQPVAASDDPTQVGVLRMELNSLRVAESKSRTKPR